MFLSRLISAQTTNVRIPWSSSLQYMSLTILSPWAKSYKPTFLIATRTGWGKSRFTLWVYFCIIINLLCYFYTNNCKPTFTLPHMWITLNLFFLSFSPSHTSSDTFDFAPWIFQVDPSTAHLLGVPKINLFFRELQVLFRYFLNAPNQKYLVVSSNTLIRKKKKNRIRKKERWEEGKRRIEVRVKKIKFSDKCPKF